MNMEDGEENRAFWPAFAAGLRGKVSPSVTPYLNNPQKVTGVWKNGKLTLWVDSEFTRSMLNKPAILDGIAKAAAASFGRSAVVSTVRQSAFANSRAKRRSAGMCTPSMGSCRPGMSEAAKVANSGAAMASRRARMW